MQATDNFQNLEHGKFVYPKLCYPTWYVFTWTTLLTGAQLLDANKHLNNESNNKDVDDEAVWRTQTNGSHRLRIKASVNNFYKRSQQTASNEKRFLSFT